MVEIGIVLGVALLFALALSFVVRIPVFGSARTRRRAIVVVASLLVVGFIGGSLWGNARVDDEARDRASSFRRGLEHYRKRPLQLITDPAPPGLPPITGALQQGAAVVVHSEVNELWVFRCVTGRVSSARVVVRTAKGKCHW